jgi:hypothetical protein
MSLGLRDIATGEINYTIEPDWYDENGSTVWSVLNLARPADGNISFSCCDGYGLAFVSESGTSPKIWTDQPYTGDDQAVKDYIRNPRIIDKESYETALANPYTTKCELDDGTIAVAVWETYNSKWACDEPEYPVWVIGSWVFAGSDGKVRSVRNTWKGNPQTHVSSRGANNWVPFAWNKPSTQRAIYTLIDGKSKSLVLTDSDITGMTCNFYNHETFNYDGADVRTSHNDLDFDFFQRYQWYPEEYPDCDGGRLRRDVVYLRKSIPSIIQVDDSGYKRYRPPQSLDTSPKDSEKGKLTNITYQGAYEILNGSPVTRNGDYNSDGTHVLDDDGKPFIDRMEQKNRVPSQRTPNYSAKDQAQIINDRERIHPYDRMPHISNNYGRTDKAVMNPMLPQIAGYASEDLKPNQKRSVWSAAGVLFVLDRDLGVNAYNQYGELQ